MTLRRGGALDLTVTPGEAGRAGTNTSLDPKRLVDAHRAAGCREDSHRSRQSERRLPSSAITTPITHTPSSPSSAHLKAERIIKFTADIQPTDVTPDSATNAIAPGSPLRTPVLATYTTRIPVVAI